MTYLDSDRFGVQRELEGYVAICLADVDDCDWHSLPSVTEDDAIAQAERHLEAEHQAADKPEDVAKTELDKGLEDIVFASQVPPDSKPVAQQQAQLHLLASIAVSLYEIRTRGLEALELLTTTQVTVQGEKLPTLDKLREEHRILMNQREDLIAQGVDPEKLKVPLAPPSDPVPISETMCHCGHAVKVHGEYGCTGLYGAGESCDCEERFEGRPQKRMHGWAEDALELKRKEQMAKHYCPHCGHLYSFHDAEGGEGCTMTDYGNGERCGCIRSGPA